jgi:periplasmic mercuric ion binding protein
MKSIKLLIASITFLLISYAGNAQVASETFKVAGECGSCKKKIEKAAKDAGASYAQWDKDSKILVVKYNSSSSNKAKIERTIAKVGYDTPDYKATDEAYNKLDGCCQYDRTMSLKDSKMCDSAKCAEAGCMKDGKCNKEMSCCKDSQCDEKDCCKKA